MGVRAPQDVDLEDRLIYGLSPLRFGYLVVAALSSLGVWRMEAIPGSIRVIPCLAFLAAGSILAWGRWRGRPMDGWAVDASVFAMRNYRVGLARARAAAASQPAAVVPLGAINALATDPVAGEIGVIPTQDPRAA